MSKQKFILAIGLSMAVFLCLFSPESQKAVAISQENWPGEQQQFSSSDRPVHNAESGLQVTTLTPQLGMGEGNVTVEVIPENSPRSLQPISLSPEGSGNLLPEEVSLRCNYLLGRPKARTQTLKPIESFLMLSAIGSLSERTGMRTPAAIPLPFGFIASACTRCGMTLNNFPKKSFGRPLNLTRRISTPDSVQIVGVN